MRRSFLTALSGAALLMLGSPVSAQLTDLQPGRNFSNSNAFGTGRSENIDIGDIDNDGDYDVVVGNGGDGTAQLNRIYVNNGGFQGGTPGTFSDGTGSRFSGVPSDTTRDVEFVDADGDCDLDVYVSNRGTTVNDGEPSRFYRNQGGAQHSTVGFYQEDTDGFWGTLISVPGADQVFGGNAGPWRDFSCDCDFGDLNLDGDIDLFHSSYGPNIQGNRDSRVFLNDGTGVFNEMWPWINAGGDIKTHTLDIDLVDLDSDFDLDVINSSRDSQARVYRNNLDLDSMSWSGDAFTDITQSALIAQGATLSGTNNYECEPGDVDGDGDFDLWMKNYNGNTDRLLRNNGDLTFTQMNSWIKGDPSVDENEVDFLDFDSDGDLDCFAANFSGTNWLYTSGLAQGLTGGQGFYHRNGTSSGGSQASWQELPVQGNTSTTLDGEAADMDGDGDPDLLLANDGNAQNRYFENVRGVPDTHAPTVHIMTMQGDKSDGSDTIIRVQLRDNANYYVIGYYGVDLIYTVDAGVENRVRMAASQGQQFQGVIPGGIDGAISYRVEGADDNGNAFASSTINYTQTSSGVVLLQNLDSGTSGIYGKPYLELDGSFAGGSMVSISLCAASPDSIAALFVSFASTPTPFRGGLLYTIPIDLQLDFASDAGGQVYFQAPWPAGLPSGVDIWYQFGIQDATHPKGATLSNAVKNTLP
ncbi:MAG: hypothetical protein DRQ55_05420 [Planctomycetota bacterium]|nr:MAG: hypothetical protein DRQ55_05420 [Planctomycetota bacterium]